MTRTNVLRIRTPEGIIFSQVLAGPMARFLAWLIDLGCVMVLSMLLSAVLAILQIVGGGFARGLMVVMQFVLMFGYSIYCEWFWRGQSVGKRALRLRVVDAQGLRLKFNQVVIRNLLRFVDILPLFYVVGGVACLLSQRAQRLGDLAANTLVVRIPKLTEPNLDQLMAGKYNSLRDYPHLEARLRQRISADEAAIALRAIVRRDSLEPAARLELFEAIAKHFQAKVTFPPEAVEGVADEQYVRNVVDSLFRPRRSGGKAELEKPSPEPAGAAPAP